MTYQEQSELDKQNRVVKAEIAMKWQLIETAPKDGTWIMIFHGHGYEEHDKLAHALVRWDDQFACWHDGEYHSDHYDPAYWMPLSRPHSREAVIEALEARKVQSDLKAVKA